MGIIMTENIYRRVAAEEPDAPARHLVVYEAATEVGGAMLTAVTNTIISFIPVFALTDAGGQAVQAAGLHQDLRHRRSVILALTLVPVLSYLPAQAGPLVARPVVAARRLLASASLAMFATHAGVHVGPGRRARAAAGRSAVARGRASWSRAAVYRMGRGAAAARWRQNVVSRGHLRACFRPGAALDAGPQGDASWPMPVDRWSLLGAH